MSDAENGRKQSVQSLMLRTSLAVGVAASAAPSAVDEEAYSELLLNSTNIVTEGFDYRAHGGANPYNMKNGTLQSTSAGAGTPGHPTATDCGGFRFRAGRSRFRLPLQKAAP